MEWNEKVKKILNPKNGIKEWKQETINRVYKCKTHMQVADWNLTILVILLHANVINTPNKKWR